MFSFQLPSVLKNSAIYTFVSFLQKGISFFLLPLYTALLTPADYGILNIVTSFSEFISILILLGLTASAGRFHFQNTDEEFRNDLWGTLTTFVIITSVVICVILLIFHKYLIDPLVGNIHFYPYIFLGIINTILSPLYIFFQSYLNTRQEGRHYGINTFFNFLINTGLIILFLKIRNDGASSVLMANVATSIIFLIYVIIYFIPRIKMGINTKLLKVSLKYSLPLVPHLLSNASAGIIDRFLINGIRNESEAGLYSIGSQFGNIVNTVTNAVNSAFSPWFMQNVIEKKNTDSKKFEQFGLFCAIFYSFLALFISFFSPEILRFMVTESFRTVWTLIPLLCFAYVFQGLYQLFINLLFIKDTKFVFAVSFSSLIVNAVLNLIFVPMFGWIGAGIACFLTYFTKSIIALVLGLVRVKEIRYPWFRMYIITFMMFAFTFLNYIFEEVNFHYTIMKLIFFFFLSLPFYIKYKGFIKSVISK